MMNVLKIFVILNKIKGGRIVVIVKKTTDIGFQKSVFLFLTTFFLVPLFVFNILAKLVSHVSEVSIEVIVLLDFWYFFLTKLSP